jgi:hypothetical protein
MITKMSLVGIAATAVIVTLPAPARSHTDGLLVTPEPHPVTQQQQAETPRGMGGGLAHGFYGGDRAK